MARKETVKAAVHRRIIVETTWREDARVDMPSDMPADVIRIAGQRFTISGSGRIRMA